VHVAVAAMQAPHLDDHSLLPDRKGLLSHVRVELVAIPEGEQRVGVWGRGFLRSGLAPCPRGSPRAEVTQ
jgi:hypothetical protein